jgi:multidrug resistance protein MdtO
MGASSASSAIAPLASMFKEELAPRPGRLAGAVRTAVCCCIVTILAMVLHIPSADLAAFLVFVLVKHDVVMTAISGLVSTVTITVAIVIAIVLASFDAGSAAIRLPLMAIATMAAMYASHALKIGPAAFLGGFALVKSQALIDESANTEELVRGMLWLWVVVALPVAVVVLVQVATGEGPGTRTRRSALGLLRALADSLRHPGVGELMSRHAGAIDLVSSARRAAMVDAKARGRLGSDLVLIETLETVVSMQSVLPVETPASVCNQLAQDCDACASAFVGEPAPPLTAPLAIDTSLDSAGVGVLPVVSAMASALARLREGIDRRNRGLAEPLHKVARRRARNDRERRENLRLAIKSTLAVICAYLIYTGFDYPGISTALTTCFFVALGTLGESVQKLTLRIAGALVGGVVAGACIAFVRPSMTDIGQLTLLIGAGALASAWVEASSVRLSYMGLQMAFAFLLGILQGYAPPSHFKGLIDRVVGILLGNVLVGVVFSTLWPTSAKDHAEMSTDQALDELASLVSDDTHPAGTRMAVLQSVGETRRLEAFAKFELHMIPEEQHAESRAGLSLRELLRITGLAFVAAELPGSPATADRLRREKARAAKLLLACKRPTDLEPAIEEHAHVTALDGATVSDRAALEASALLLAELEKAYGVAS